MAKPRICPECDQPVPVTRAPSVYARHMYRDEQCAGTGLLAPMKDARPGQRPPANASKVARIGEPSARERELIRGAEGRERAQRAAVREADGGANSVRTVSGGLPSLGRGA